MNKYNNHNSGKGYNPNTVNAKKFNKRMEEVYNTDGHEHVFSKASGLCVHCEIHKNDVKRSQDEEEPTTK